MENLSAFGGFQADHRLVKNTLKWKIKENI